MTKENIQTIEEFRNEIIEKVEESVDAGDSSKIAYIHQILPYLEGLTSEWGEDPQEYIGDSVQAFFHSEDWDTLDFIISDYYGRNYKTSPGYDSVRRLQNRFSQSEDILYRALDGDYEDFDESDELYILSKEIFGHKKDIRNARFILITDSECFSGDSATEPELPDETKEIISIKHIVWTLEKIYNLECSALTPLESLEIDFMSTYQEKIPCIKVDFGNTNVEYDSYLGYMKGELLAKLYKDFNTKLLEGNIRVYLQTTTPVNRGIMKTLTSKVNPNEKTRFFAYNNGISATAESLTLSEPDNTGTRWIEKIKGLQIVNGGQTTASMYSAWKQNHKFVDGVFVQMKLTIPNDGYYRDELNGKIAEFSNTQNQIKKTDFTANEPYQISLEQQAKNTLVPGKDYGWFYERTRGLYKEMVRIYNSKGKREQAKEIPFDKRFPSSRVITKTELAIYYNTWNQYPHLAAMGGEKNFKHFFKNLENENGDIKIKPDNRYFRELISMAILFISTDNIVKEWQNPDSNCIYGHTKYGKGLKREIVVYTLSLLSYLAKGHFRLEKIWDYQPNHGLTKKTITLPKSLEEYIVSLIQVSEKVINTVLPGQNPNRSEEAKKEGFWSTMISEAEKKHLEFPETLISEGYYLNSDEFEQREKWIESITISSNESITEETGSESSELQPARNETATDETPKIFSKELPADLKSLFNKKSQMDLGRLIADLETEEILSGEQLSILQLILNIIRKHKPVPADLSKKGIEILKEIRTNQEQKETTINPVTIDSHSDSVMTGPVSVVAEPPEPYTADDEDTDVFIYKSKGAVGKMKLYPRGRFLLLKGSTVSLNEAPSIKKDIHDLRQDMLRKSVLIPNPDGITATLTDDLIVHSSGDAAGIVSANCPSGPSSWKMNGKTLKEYQNK